jgi:hypothetical protein
MSRLPFTYVKDNLQTIFWPYGPVRRGSLQAVRYSCTIDRMLLKHLASVSLLAVPDHLTRRPLNFPLLAPPLLPLDATTVLVLESTPSRSLLSAPLGRLSLDEDDRSRLISVLNYHFLGSEHSSNDFNLHGTHPRASMMHCRSFSSRDLALVGGLVLGWICGVVDGIPTPPPQVGPAIANTCLNGAVSWYTDSMGETPCKPSFTSLFAVHQRTD